MRNSGLVAELNEQLSKGLGGTRIVQRTAQVLWLSVLVCAPVLAQQPSPPVSPGITPPASAAPGEDGQWTMPAKNFAATRYSDLAEINTDNVKNLQVAFTFSTGVNKGQEAAPLVV